MEISFGGFRLIFDVLGSLWMLSDSLWTPRGFTLMLLGSIWGVLGAPGRPLGSILEPIGLILATLGVPKSSKVIQDGVWLT